MLAPMVVASAVLCSMQQPDPPQGWQDPGYNKLVWDQSPNFGKRPNETIIDTIVLHHTAGATLGGTVLWFRKTESQVSAHFTIGKDGSIVQHVSTFDRAWHAGVSKDHRGKDNLNNFSIGIEMVNTGSGSDPWPKEQVEVVKFLCAHLKKRFPTIRYITSHEYIAEPQGRKNDPKAFPWDDLKELGLEMYYGLKPKP